MRHLSPRELSEGNLETWREGSFTRDPKGYAK